MMRRATHRYATYYPSDHQVRLRHEREGDSSAKAESTGGLAPPLRLGQVVRDHLAVVRRAPEDGWDYEEFLVQLVEGGGGSGMRPNDRPTRGRVRCLR